MSSLTALVGDLASGRVTVVDLTQPPRGAWVLLRSGWSRRTGDGFHNLQWRPGPRHRCRSRVKH